MRPLPLWLTASGVASAVAVIATDALLRLPRLLARNYLGKPIPTAYGIAGAAAQALALGMVLAVGLRVPERVVLLSSALALLCALGLLDDLFGGAATGFRGHLRALLRQKRITTGIFKLLFGAGACLVIGVTLRPEPLWQGIADGLLLASFANLLNLLDRRPGRAQKVFVLGLAVALLLKGWRPVTPLLPFAAAMLAFLPEDLMGRKMMGDAGSNPLGLALAFLLLDASVHVRLAALSVALALNLASERWSFTQIIERNRLLRFLDNLLRPT